LFFLILKGERNYENLEFGPAYKANERFTDAWGCVWVSSIEGLESQVVESPLDKREKLKDYQVPESLKQAERGLANWELTQRESFALIGGMKEENKGEFL